MNLKRYVRLVLITIFSISSLQFCATSGQLPTAKTFIEAIEQQKDATTYLRLIEGAGGLVNVLGEEKYALVVPVDAAFNTLGMEKLLQLLTPNSSAAGQTLRDHILVGAFSPKVAAVTPTASTRSGKTIKVEAGTPLKIGGAPVTKTVKTKDGYVYFVSILPTF